MGAGRWRGTGGLADRAPWEEETRARAGSSASMNIATFKKSETFLHKKCHVVSPLRRPAQCCPSLPAHPHQQKEVPRGGTSQDQLPYSVSPRLLTCNNRSRNQLVRKTWRRLPQGGLVAVEPPSRRRPTADPLSHLHTFPPTHIPFLSLTPSSTHVKASERVWSSLGGDRAMEAQKGGDAA